MKRSILILSTIVIVFFSSLTNIASTYNINEASTIYSINGKYKQDSTIVTVNTYLTISIRNGDTNPELFVDFVAVFNDNTLPYNINIDFVILTTEEIENKHKNNITLSENTENNAFYNWYGLKYFYGEIDVGNYVIRCTWDFYTGLLYRMEIEMKHEVYTVLTILFRETNINLYENYSTNYINKIMFVKTIFSPAGLVIIVAGAFLIVCLIPILSKLQKKTKIQTRYRR